MVFPFSLCLTSVLGQLRLCIISSYTEKAGGPRCGFIKYIEKMTGMKPPVVDKLLGPDLPHLWEKCLEFSQAYLDLFVVKLGSTTLIDGVLP